MSVIRRPWDTHILLVFSVLVSVALAQNFEVVGKARFRTAESLLFLLVFYVVLDNWYHLHKTLYLVDIDSGPEIISHLIYLVPSSCLPYLYGVQSGATSSLDSVDWMLLNLALVCLTDSIRKAIAILKYRSARAGLTDEVRKVLGSYFFYATTGFLYAIVLGLLITYSLSAWVAIILWVVIRTIDLVATPRISATMSKIILESDNT